MAYWRKLKSRFEYEVAIGDSEADRDRVLDIVKQIDPDAWWVRVDGQYVICSNQSQAAVSAMLIGPDPDVRKAKE